VKHTCRKCGVKFNYGKSNYGCCLDCVCADHTRFKAHIRRMDGSWVCVGRGHYIIGDRVGFGATPHLAYQDWCYRGWCLS
jgi:hypothetical protein